MQGTTTRQITEAAQQRNASAVTYHFGSRQGLLLALLARRGGPVDAARGDLRAALGDGPVPARALVGCLVQPYTDLLASEAGRSYVRIVAQLRGRFAAWRVESDVETTRHLAVVLDELEEVPDGPPAVRQERVVALIMLLTSSVAERARRLDEADGPVGGLDHGAYVDNLTTMLTALLTA